MEMLVGEQKQDGVALLLDPAGRRSLISPFRSSRKCRMFVEAEASAGLADTPGVAQQDEYAAPFRLS
jgi:hypothetical protein